MLRECIDKLLEQQDLSIYESQLAIQEIVTSANASQIGAFLTLMRAKGETVDEMTGIIQAMQSLMLPLSLTMPVLDMAGTGGDGAHTFNISTGASILAASCGVKIAKHGNRSVSSRCGSADVLEALGVNIEMQPEAIVSCIKELGIGFLYAPKFHPAMKNLGLLRRELGVRTAFNIVYPLVNPARAQYQMVGVFHEKLLDLVALCLYKSGTRRALVFHGHGLDELSCIGPAKALEVTPEGINSFTLDPEAYGLPLCKKEELKGGSIEENAHILRDIFSGTTSAKSDTLIFNAGVAIYLYGKTASIEEGIALAKKRLEEGAPDELLKQWRMR